MPKKKQARGTTKARKNDSRGYGQPMVSNPAAVVPSKEVKTHNVQPILDELHSLLPSLASSAKPPTRLNPRDVKRFRRKVESTYDTLTAFGFRIDQISSAISSLGARILDNDQACLDWLCSMLPSEELPHLFTEGTVREQLSEPEATIEVTFAPAKPNAGAMQSRIAPIPYPEIRMARPTDENSETEQKKEDASHNKKWIMSQYQYEESTSSIDDDIVHSTSQLEGFDQSVTIVERETKKENVQMEEPIEEREDPVLLKMRAELQELKDDIANEANNYMRSKQEIKDLQDQIKTLEIQISKLEAKTQNSKAKIRSDDNVDDVEEEYAFFDLFGPTDESDANCDSNGGNCASTEKATEQEKNIVVVGNGDLSIPSDCIPKSWTGPTPRRILEDWCKQNRWDRPKFSALNRKDGCHLSIRNLDLDFSHSVGRFEIVQHYLAVKALYKIDSSLQLYLRFPPFFRDQWLKWCETDRLKKNAAIDILKTEKIQLVNRLVDLVPLQSDAPDVGIVNKSNTLSTETTTTGNNALDSLGPVSRLPYECKSTSEFHHVTNPTTSGHHLQDQWRKHCHESSLYKRMLMIRKQLPIHSYRQQIIDLVVNNPVTILCAETGSGKTTQCASFILEEAMRSGYGDKVSILCSQPRRVAALSVAERVSEELGEERVGGLVGYSIRLESRKSTSTRILFCTTGIILRRLVDDPHLEGVSHLVLDEVHERQWQIDVLLTGIRLLLRTARPDLKMSATLDKKLFSDFFDQAPVIDIPGRTFPVSNRYLEDLIEETGYVVEDDSQYCLRDFSRRETVTMMVTNRGGERKKESADYQRDVDVSGRFPSYSMSTQISMDRVNEATINYDFIEHLLEQICVNKNSPLLCEDNTSCHSGDAILIFLPGVGEINSLVDRLKATRRFGDGNKYKILPLHSGVSSLQQKEAFKVPEVGCRKMVISTNIAETR